MFPTAIQRRPRLAILGLLSLCAWLAFFAIARQTSAGRVVCVPVDDPVEVVLLHATGERVLLAARSTTRCVPVEFGRGIDSQRVLWTLPGGGRLLHSQNPEEFYLWRSTTLSRVSWDAGETLNEVPLPSDSELVALDDREARVVCAGADVLSCIDRDSGAVVWRIDREPEISAMAVDDLGRRLFVTDGSHDVSVHDLDTGLRITVARELGHAQAFLVNSATRKLVIAGNNLGNGVVRIASLDDLTDVATVYAGWGGMSFRLATRDKVCVVALMPRDKVYSSGRGILWIDLPRNEVVEHLSASHEEVFDLDLSGPRRIVTAGPTHVCLYNP